jgi:predicted permease
MARWLRELRLAARSLRRAPGFTFATIAVLGLAIGANVAVLTIARDVLLRPLDFPGSERTAILCETHERVGGYCVASPPNAFDWEAQSRTLERIGIAREWPVVVRGADGAGRGRDAAVATAGWFDVVGLEAVAGRLIGAGDLASMGGPMSVVGEPASGGDDQVVVLAQRLARELYGSESAAIGQTLGIDGRPFAVIGVLADEPRSPLVGEPELWLPLTAIQDDVTNRAWRGFSTIGRMAPGTTPEDVRRELAVIAERLREAYPEPNEGWGTRAELLRTWIAAPALDQLRLLVAAVVLVLLIGCANVANLMLARGHGRRQELGVRLALGARPLDMVRTVLAEGTLLAAAGGVLGLALGAAAIEGAVRWAPPGVPRLDEVTIGLGTLLLASLLVVVSLLAFSLVPAVAGVRSTLAAAVRSRLSRGGLPVRDLLVVAELALALMLLAGAGLLLRGFGALLEWDPGFPTQGVATAFLYSSDGDFPTGEAVVRHHQQAAEVVGALPGVLSVGLTSAGPLFGGEETAEVEAVGASWPGAAGGTAPRARYYDVDPGYLPTLGIAVLRGRNLLPTDRAGGVPVALVNASLAERLFPGVEAVGRQVRMFDREWTVVGVIADVPPFDPTRPVESEAYVPKAQFPRWGTTLVVRVEGDPGRIERSVRDGLARFDPDLQVGSWVALHDRRDRALAAPAFSAGLVGAFAAAALLLAAIGAYGVIAYSVASRTREIGIRLALGARPGTVVRGVVGRGMSLAGFGLALGGLGAVLAASLLESMLYGVRASDPVALCGVLLLFGGVALLASWLPARRAGRLDPTRALRAE